ncbi:MAG: transglycosylase domain-containing protein [Acidimicrobiales bacterium]
MGWTAMWFRLPWIVIRLVVTMGVAALAVTGGVLALRPAAKQLDALGHLEFGATINLRPLAERSLMYDRYGGLMGVLHAEQNRSQVALADVPQHVVDAILAIEDWDFYEHDGVDLRSTVRALFENVESGGVTQGGSTITMQVIKLSLLSPEQSLERKVREAILAMRLEEQMTKEQILERYLNMVYFGNGAYGLQAAAELYFRTNVQTLTWGQAALLAGLIRDPIDYDPFKHPDIAAQRRQVALARLVEVGRLTEPDVALISTEPLPVIPAVPPLPQPLDYFPEDVKQQLLRDPRFNLGATPTERYNSVFYGGLRIHTTYDPAAQAAAIQARADVLPGDEPTTFLWTNNRQPYEGTATVVSVEPQTGAVRTLVGGPGYERYQYSIASDPRARRDNGSSFKIFVLVAALEAGYLPGDSLDGSSPCTFRNPGGTPDPYRLENFEGGGGGGGSILSQTLRSSNCAFVRLGQAVGIQNVVAQAQRMGVTVDLPVVPSLPLGVGGVPALQFAGAMASIANDGVFNQPYYIERIDDRAGNVIYQHQPNGVAAMSPQTARLAMNVLVQNIQSGTGTRARVPNQPAGGKTGTAHDYGDAWFVGATPQLATTVWVGSLGDVIPMRTVPGTGRVTGGSLPARIWGKYMATVLAGAPRVDWPAASPPRGGRTVVAPTEVRGGTTQTTDDDD